MPRAKGTCFDPGIEATLLMRQPGVLEADRVVDDLVSNVDVFTTLLEMAETSALTIDTAPHRWSELCALLHGDTDSYVPREHVFSGMTWYDRYNPVRAVRTERWKYIRNFWHLPAVYMTTDTYCTHAGREVSEEYYGEQRSYENCTISRPTL